MNVTLTVDERFDLEMAIARRHSLPGPRYPGDVSGVATIVTTTVEGIVAARLAAVEALADEWENTVTQDLYFGRVLQERAAALRAAVRAEPSEVTT